MVEGKRGNCREDIDMLERFCALRDRTATLYCLMLSYFLVSLLYFVLSA